MTNFFNPRIISVKHTITSIRYGGGGGGGGVKPETQSKDADCLSTFMFYSLESIDHSYFNAHLVIETPVIEMIKKVDMHSSEDSYTIKPDKYNIGHTDMHMLIVF